MDRVPASVQRADEDGDPWLIQGVMFDISEREAAEEQVAFLAYHDKLTGLPNRALFEELLETAIARARRHDLGVGVVYLDLDNFKLVNDSLGHHAGDLLLAQLGDRLRGCTRETDLVARQGGDEFLVLLADLARRRDGPGLGLAGRRIGRRTGARGLREPFDLAGTQFYATGSLGISLFPTGRERRALVAPQRRPGDVPVQSTGARSLRVLRGRW